MKETITLNTQEQKRLMILNRLIEGQLTAVEASEVLDLSERQVRRLLAAYWKEGVAAVVHRHRGCTGYMEYQFKTSWKELLVKPFPCSG